MKKFLFAVLLTASLVVNYGLSKELRAAREEQTVSLVNERHVVVEAASQTDWDAFITALAWVESRWDDNAESPKQAVGYLQITPVLVEDANRIVGKEMFTLDGRYDRKESIRLFNVIMDNYNPEHDMQFALKLWNPYSKVSYHRAVMRKYNELARSRNLVSKI